MANLDDQYDDDLSPKSRVAKIERLIEAGDYDEESAVRDILSDLRHYCDEYGLVFVREDKQGYQHYREEKNKSLPD